MQHADDSADSSDHVVQMIEIEYDEWMVPAPGTDQEIGGEKTDVIVQVCIKKDYRQGWVTIDRMDDGTNVESRPMTTDEIERGMTFDSWDREP